MRVKVLCVFPGSRPARRWAVNNQNPAGKTRSTGSGGYRLGKTAGKSRSLESGTSALGTAAGSGCPGLWRLRKGRLAKVRLVKHE